MASLVRVQIVEQQIMDMAELRARMQQHGVGVNALARESGIVHSSISAILQGRQYLGPVRTARLLTAVKALGLDDDEAS